MARILAAVLVTLFVFLAAAGLAAAQDTESPVTTITLTGSGTGEDEWFNSSIRVTLECFDNVACEKTLYCNYSWGEECTDFEEYTEPFNVIREGINYIGYYSIDTSGEPPKTSQANIDLVPPGLVMLINGVPADPENRIVDIQNVTQVTVLSNLTDPDCPFTEQQGSCPWINRIEWEKVTVALEKDSLEVRRKDIPSIENIKNFTITPDLVSIKFRAFGQDRAGNTNQTDYYWITKHPLANFISRELYIVLGTSYFTKVAVRNLGDEEINITLTLAGYSYAWFTGDFEGRAENVTLEEAGRVANVINLEPGEEALLTMDVTSGELGRNQDLFLDAAGAGQIDSDEMIIHVDYPPEFPGLEAWAVVLLVILSAGLYFLAEKKRF